MFCFQTKRRIKNNFHKQMKKSEWICLQSDCVESLTPLGDFPEKHLISCEKRLCIRERTGMLLITCSRGKSSERGNQSWSPESESKPFSAVTCSSRFVRNSSHRAQFSFGIATKYNKLGVGSINFHSIVSVYWILSGIYWIYAKRRSRKN